MELYTSEQSSPSNVAQNNKQSKKIILKRILLWALLALGIYIVFWVISLFVSADKHIRQIYLVPKDAALIIESSEPVKDWKKFSTSEPWQTLKTSETFSYITENANRIDSIVHSNKILLSLVGKRDMLISLHKTKSNDWDFLAIVDMQRISKMNALKEQIEKILTISGYSASQRTYNGINIIDMRDPDSRDVLYIAFVDNHLIASYTPSLVHASIDERNNPKIGLDDSFLDVEHLVSGKGLCRVYVNYKHLSEFLGIYIGGQNEYIDMFCNAMDYAGLYCNVSSERMDARGYTLLKEAGNPYMEALMNSGTHKMKAHNILTARTAFYTNIGIGKPSEFAKELEKVLEETDPKSHKAYLSSRKKIENLFGISLEDNFLSWMSGEFAVIQCEPGLLGREPELILAIKAKTIKDAQKNMEFIETQIRRRTPLKIKAVEYKNYNINYVELNGFFRLFFGNLFDSFEKPYYTYIDDYIVFSNKSASLLSFIEDYEQKNLLKNDSKFREAISDFKANSTIFTYIDIEKFYPLLNRMATPSMRNDLAKNKEVFYSFPVWSLQVIGDVNQPSMYFLMKYDKYNEPSADQNIENEDREQSERELISELKRFHLEKFEGNILRDYYSNETLKYETEIRFGVRHGRHRVYYENGNLKIRGKYSNGKPSGTWKFYTEDGKFERKEKF